MQERYLSAVQTQKKLEDLYQSKAIDKDASKIQCSKCHLHLGHSKRQCHLHPCTTSEMCGDPRKHKDEFTKLKTATDAVAKLRKEIDELATSIDTKKDMAANAAKSFEQRVTPILIESNKEKYLVMTSAGVKKRQGILYTDLCKLKDKFNQKIPHNIEAMADQLQDILNDYGNALRNPVPAYQGEFPTKGKRNTAAQLDILKDRGIKMKERKPIFQNIQLSRSISLPLSG